MDGTAVKEIERLSREAAAAVIDGPDGVQFSTVPVYDLRRKEQEPEVLEVHTLNGLVEYIRTNASAGGDEGDGLDRDAVMLHIAAPDRVELVSGLRGEFNQRLRYASAVLLDRFAGYPAFSFGRWMDVESMLIALQALFAAEEGRAGVLRLLGNMKGEAVKTNADDGVTQTVSTRVGVLMSGMAEVPNPVYLAAYRTFPEIPGPIVPYILRVRLERDQIQVALFEADGGAWRLEAIDRIATFLRAAELGITILA